MNCLCPLKHWDRGFESHLRYGCLYAFILFVLSCVQEAALRWANTLSKESYRLCKRSRNWKGGQGPAKGCRAIDRYNNMAPTGTCEPGSSIVIATDYRLDSWDLNLGKIFLFATAFRPVWGPRSLLHSGYRGATSLGSKAAGAWSWPFTFI
jgi:hypothetical protein